MSNNKDQNNSKDSEKRCGEPSQNYSVTPNINKPNDRPDFIKHKQKKKKK